MKTLIIPAAGKPQNILFPGVYDLMVPINGKPTINYILENAKKWKIEKIIILLNKSDNKTLKYLQFLSFGDISFVYELIDSSSLGETILFAERYLKQNDEIIIQLGDTILTQNLDFSKDFISVSDKKILNPEKWTFIDDDFCFYDKKSNFHQKCYLVNGIYFIKQYSIFFEYLKKYNDFYSALEKYFKSIDGKLEHHSEGYYDLGHLDEYYKSKIDFLRVRSFNSLQYDDFRGIITKKSSNNEKLSWEINWFKNLPSDLKNFTPRLVDYYLGEKVEYSLEFYGYTSLADIFLYGEYSESYLESVLQKIFSYLLYVKNNYNDKNFAIKNFYEMYFDKTFERVEKMLENDVFKNIYYHDEIIVNGKKYKNIKDIFDQEKLQKFINEEIYNPDDCTIIHGDMCFSNILFDINNGIFKFIDPRGKFGETGIWGDIKYDIAKFRHSVHGRYENIISDLFNLEYTLEKNIFDFQYFDTGNRKKIIAFFDKEVQEMGYDIKTIKFIEGLLYLTMIPLHSDSLNRQILMYMTAVILFNEIF